MLLLFAPRRDMARHDVVGRDASRQCRQEKKPPVATPRAAPSQEASLSSSGGTREPIQASTAEQCHATLQAPSCIRRGNFPTFSSRAICWCD